MDNKQRKTANNISIIAECAVLIAVGTILAQIKIFRMPNGGSVTAASMVPFLLISYRHGTKWGLLSGFVNALLQMLLGSIYPPVAPGAAAYFLEILLDYILAYMVLGFSGSFCAFFSKLLSKDRAKSPQNDKSKMLVSVGISTFVCCLLRFFCAFLSGFLVWDDVLQNGMAAVIYSLGYNASYLGPESVITVIVTLILYKAYPAFFKSGIIYK